MSEKAEPKEKNESSQSTCSIKIHPTFQLKGVLVFAW